MHKHPQETALVVLTVTFVLSIIASVTAWCTHVIWCLQNHEYLLLLAGALVAPVGVIHGICIWLGMPWL